MNVVISMATVLTTEKTTLNGEPKRRMLPTKIAMVQPYAAKLSGQQSYPR
jgi:hypothetical protein